MFLLSMYSNCRSWEAYGRASSSGIGCIVVIFVAYLIYSVRAFIKDTLSRKFN